MKKASRQVKESRERAGVKPTSLALTDEEKAEIDELASELGVSRKAAILEAVRKYSTQGEPTKEWLIMQLRKRLT